MDLANPIESLIPGARGRILRTLAGADVELTLSQLHDLAGVSINQVPKVVAELERLSVVTVKEVPPATLVSLNRESLVGQVVLRLAHSAGEVLEKIRELTKSMNPKPVTVCVYGSFARRLAGPESDIDILFVRPEAANSDDWYRSMASVCDAVSDFSGNTASHIEIEVSKVTKKLLRQNFWSEVTRDGLFVNGPSLEAVANG